MLIFCLISEIPVSSLNEQPFTVLLQPACLYHGVFEASPWGGAVEHS